jgi:PTH1 family peptidyl-tRNA hydrolase
MKYLIVGLGNPGAEYEDTRHNIGFKVLDQLAQERDSAFKLQQNGWVTTIKHKGRTLFLLKPNTYMNRSGKAVAYYMQQENISVENTMVVLDDIALDFGVMRIRANGSDGGHNGLKSIDSVLGHQKYPRLRMGIGNDFHPGQQADYVLGKWNSEEKKGLNEFIGKGAEAVLSFTSIGIQHTMNLFNKK